MNLYHYFDKSIGAFKNLSELPIDQAKNILETIKKEKPNVQCAVRQPAYIEERHYYEEILRMEFKKRGGIIKKNYPHYMVVEHSPWLSTWFENCDLVMILLREFDLRTISFTYGDSHPVFSPRVNRMDGKE